MDKRLHGSAGKLRVPAGPALGRPARWAAGGSVALLLAALLTWVLWPDDERPDPRSRVYTDASACLLTPARGLADTAVAPVWAGMQQASLATSGRASFLEVDGPQTGANAATYLATLASGGCDLVLVAGAAPVAAVVEQAGRYPSAHFVVVGADSGKSLANVVWVQESDEARITERVRELTVSALSTQED